MDNAACHSWMKELHTARFLQDGTTQCFSEVMAKLLLAAQILMDNAAFHSWMKEFHTSMKISWKCMRSSLVSACVMSWLLETLRSAAIDVQVQKAGALSICLPACCI